MLSKNVDLNNTVILVTGAAGFVGANLVMSLLSEAEGTQIIGIDSVNDYYDVALKEYRLQQIDELSKDNKNIWIFKKGNIADKSFVDEIFAIYKPRVVVNLAAQAGVRYSITNPDAYIESNIIGFYNILEACRHSNELLAYSYAKLYNIPSTGLRFFTVYGPAGRPDMAYFGFTNTLRNGGTIKIFNYGNCKRDFTYIDDIVEGVSKVMSTAPERRNGADGLPVPPYAIYNIGNSNPENLLDFVRILSEELVSAGVLSEDYNFEEHKELVPMQPGDVPVTYADTSALEADFGFKPNTTLREGLKRFAIWYKDFYMMEGK
ncbi:MAG: GDP-mannose 4,6-dehydratase [Veillonella sp.]|nr:GDP-mannose 4,6-dehydratase [Veillonella sp.]